MLEDERVLQQPDGLAIGVGVARRVAELVHELDAVLALVDRPLPGVDDLVGFEPPIGGLLGFANGADTDPHEALSDLRFRVTESRLAGEKLLHRTGDGVVDLRIVAIEPLPEVLVSVPLEAGYHARPVEAGAAVVPGLRIGQIKRRANGGVRDLCLGKLRCRHLVQHDESDHQ